MLKHAVKHFGIELGWYLRYLLTTFTFCLVVVLCCGVMGFMIERRPGIAIGIVIGGTLVLPWHSFRERRR